MRTIIILLAVSFAIYSCGSSNTGITSSPDNTIRIANDSLEYEIVIIESGFNSWILSQPPRNFHSESYLETKNRLFVSEFNNRVLQPRYSQSLYSEQINYDPKVSYGFEVNYLLYNYFMFFQEKYDQHLTGGRN